MWLLSANQTLVKTTVLNPNLSLHTWQCAFYNHLTGGNLSVCSVTTSVQDFVIIHTASN